MLGFDTLYKKNYQDEEMARLSSAERRILLTRDRGLLKRNVISRGYYVRATEPAQQLIEVVREFELTSHVFPFRRCMHCNAVLQEVRKEAISQRLLPETAKHFEEFYACPDCHRVYWKGSHLSPNEAIHRKHSVVARSLRFDQSVHSRERLAAPRVLPLPATSESIKHL
jgi:hypothetical protein